MPYEEEKYGKFHVGDSFIVLATTETRGVFRWEVHFWLGNETSQDESGSAALLTVALDDVLGGGPVQHRELQGHESQLFLSYFTAGIRSLPGGVKSGFTAYDPEDVERRLFRVKGKRNVQIMEVNNSSYFITSPHLVTLLGSALCFIPQQVGLFHSGRRKEPRDPGVDASRGQEDGAVPSYPDCQSDQRRGSCWQC